MSSSMNCIRYYQLFAVYFVKINYSNILYFEINFTIIWLPYNFFLLFSLVSNNLTNYERRHFKLFTNCHVSWDTLYEKDTWMLRFNKILNVFSYNSAFSFHYQEEIITCFVFMALLSWFAVLWSFLTEMFSLYRESSNL